LKEFKTFPTDWMPVLKAVLVLVSNEKQDFSENKFKELVVSNTTHFFELLKKFNAETIEKWKLELISPLKFGAYFNFDSLMKTSELFAYLCEWCNSVLA